MDMCSQATSWSVTPVLNILNIKSIFYAHQMTEFPMRDSVEEEPFGIFSVENKGPAHRHFLAPK